MNQFEEIHEYTTKRRIKIDDDEAEEGNCIIIYEKQSLDTAGKIWESAIVLGKYLQMQIEEQQITFENKTILDIGCGTGVLSIFLASISKANITATDLPQVQSLCEKNIAANTLLGNIHFKVLEWSFNKTRTQNTIPICDYILASDVTFNEKSMEGFFTQLRYIYEYQSPITYLIHKLRHEELDLELKKQLESLDLVYERVDNTHPTWRSNKQVIYVIFK